MDATQTSPTACPAATADQLAQIDTLATQRDVDPVELETIRDGAAGLTFAAAAAVIDNLAARPLAG